MLSLIPMLLLYTIFIGNQIAQYIGISSDFTSSYLDDLLCFPIVFHIVQLVQRQIFNKNYIVSFPHIILGVILFSITFEIVLPQFSNSYVTDYFDVIFYLIGAVIFYFINSINSNKSIGKTILH